MTRVTIIPDALSSANETPAMQSLSELLESFIALINEENSQLARGLPSGSRAISARKNDLASALEIWVKAAATRQVRLDDLSDPQRQKFVDRLAFFQRTMDENMRRLEAAIEASHRRIEAVMAAVREEVAKNLSYGSDGKPAGNAGHTSIGNGLRI
jgi:hypothetical protein